MYLKIQNSSTPAKISILSALEKSLQPLLALLFLRHCKKVFALSMFSSKASLTLNINKSWRLQGRFIFYDEDQAKNFELELFIQDLLIDLKKR